MYFNLIFKLRGDDNGLLEVGLKLYQIYFEKVDKDIYSKLSN